MATNLLYSSCNYGDEDYIDMEVSASSTGFLGCSPPQTREFEFQMSTISQEGECTSSPADELFYKGKLLPLYLPPRLQMVKKLLQNVNTQEEEDDDDEENFITISTPMESCNISPSESCRVSTELNPDEYFFEWSTEFRGFIGDLPKKSWSKKLKLIKHSSISQKLKASRAYLKSFFSKSGCTSDGSSCTKLAACSVEESAAAAGDNNYFLSKYMKVTKKSAYGQIQKAKYPTLANIIKGIEDGTSVDNVSSHRRSFSAAIKRHSLKTKCSHSSSSSSSASASASSSSSSSFNYSSGFHELQLLKRSSSASSELEGSIEAAIAHCKKSHHPYTTTSTNPFNESGFFSKTLSCNNQDSNEAKFC